MKVLLDTHAFLWYVLDGPQLSGGARSTIDGDDNEVLVSPASYWEIAIKISIGKYSLTVPYEKFWRSGIDENGFRVLPIEVGHTSVLLNMPYHHRDPFDRLLVAQSIAEQIPLISSDASLDAYPIQRIW